MRAFGLEGLRLEGLGVSGFERLINVGLFALGLYGLRA